MSRSIIIEDGKPTFVVIPIEEWRQIEATLEDRVDAHAVRRFRETSPETFPDSVAAALTAGATPLKAFREYRGFSQAKLAKSAGTSAVYISQLERGVRGIGRKLRAKLARALRIDPALLDQE